MCNPNKTDMEIAAELLIKTFLEAVQQAEKEEK